MRLPLYRPSELTAEQRSFYDASEKIIESASLAGFQAKNGDGAFLGPWSVLMNFPALATGLGQFVSAVENMRGLSDRARQVVILTVGGHLNAAYELYAHSAIGAHAGLTRDQIAILSAGGRPTDLTVEESLAAEVATALLRGGVLPAPTYEAVVTTLGQDALDTAVFVTIHYLVICSMLNAYDVPPGEPTSWLSDAAHDTTRR
ncbi:carboxymuconolactone decarboxylase family protein [Mycobacterium sp.]|uniref:carboxymuconolactone decarboxylase family protein n=1 Tax=Mycobacterium sp. TaxID=1785 RepID=UPI003D10AD3D